MAKARKTSTTRTDAIRRVKGTRVEVRQSPIHGRGVFALQTLKAESRVLEYKGDRISHAEADRRYGKVDDSKPDHTFLMTLNRRWVIDATPSRGWAKWINHACVPNCEAWIEGEHIWIHAIRDIRRGEELFIDYGLNVDSDDDPARYTCRCGSPQCRGTMLGVKPSKG
jgi:SET domain-containing protein